MKRFPPHDVGQQLDEEDVLVVYTGDLSNETVAQLKATIFDRLRLAPEALLLVDGREHRANLSLGGDE